MLDLKKKELELMKVECAKAEMEVRIFEAEENIQRMRDNIVIQDGRCSELKEEINKLKQ